MPFTVHVEPSGHSFEVGAGRPCSRPRCATRRAALRLPRRQVRELQRPLLSGQVDYPEGPPPALDGAAAGACICCRQWPCSDLAPAGARGGAGRGARGAHPACRVVQIDHLAHDVVRLYLKLQSSSDSSSSRGSTSSSCWPTGGSAAFSIASAPHDDALIELHLRHVPGRPVHRPRLLADEGEGDLRIRAPLGTFVLREDRPADAVRCRWHRLRAHQGDDRARLPTSDRAPDASLLGRAAERDLYLPDLPRQWAQSHPVSASPRCCPSRCRLAGAPRVSCTRAVLEDYADLGAVDVYMAAAVMIEAARAASPPPAFRSSVLYSDASSTRRISGKP